MKTIAISGGFTVLHKGHTRLIMAAAHYGDVIVFLNSDEWIKRKYGYVVQDFQARREVLLALKGVASVIMAEDNDGTVCKSLERFRPDYFANGGDRGPENTPELKLCADLGIKPLFNVGGDKVASSSEVLNAAR